MNRHTLRHGDVVISNTGRYRMYVCSNKDDDNELMCVSLNHDLNYGTKYKAGYKLIEDEEFVCNIMDIVCANTQ